jgi:hypothetical protein
LLDSKTEKTVAGYSLEKNTFITIPVT